MKPAIDQALHSMLNNWNSMFASDNEEAESTADQFQASFYLFIDTVREWVYQLDRQPKALDEFLELPEVVEIVQLLPPPLYINFETEAELILERTMRIEDEKYD